jgi:hypothetical protein
MKIEYTIKGITLNEFEMYDIKKFYEAHCTAEYIFENYDVTEEKAIKLGYEVRRLMDKYGGDEEDAIYEAMRNLNINEREDDDHTPSAENGDYSPSNPWDAPGMSMKDFI